jgi:hypothetical protein
MRSMKESQGKTWETSFGGAGVCSLELLKEVSCESTNCEMCLGGKIWERGWEGGGELGE